MSHPWSRVHSVSVLIVSQSCAPLAEGGGMRGSSPMKRVCKQTFDIALFTAPAVRALERFMLYVSVIIYFICYMYTILWHLLSRRVHRSIYGMYTVCVCPSVCVRYAQLVCCTHSHTLKCQCIKIEISAAIKTNLWADFNMRYLCVAHISIPLPLPLPLSLGSGRNCVFMLGICRPSCVHFRTQINTHTHAHARTRSRSRVTKPNSKYRRHIHSVHTLFSIYHTPYIVS